MQEEENISFPNTSQKVLLFFGERLAIILFFIFVLFLFFSGRIPQVLSVQEEPQVIKADQTWYQNGVEFSTPQQNSIKEDYQIERMEITPTPTPLLIDPSDNNVWLKLADCESHQNWADDTGNGYYGGLQFSLGAWNSVGGSGNPAQASREEQITRGKLLQGIRGWGAWGGCSKKLGL